MKKIAVLGAVILLQAVASRAAQPLVTGGEWLKLDSQEQVAAVKKAVEGLKSYGVPTAKTPEEYAADIRAVFEKRPDYRSMDVESILASVVYREEPEARRAIDSSVNKIRA